MSVVSIIKSDLHDVSDGWSQEGSGDADWSCLNASENSTSATWPGQAWAKDLLVEINIEPHHLYTTLCAKGDVSLSILRLLRSLQAEGRSSCTSVIALPSEAVSSRPLGRGLVRRKPSTEGLSGYSLGLQAAQHPLPAPPDAPDS